MKLAEGHQAELVIFAAFPNKRQNSYYVEAYGNLVEKFLLTNCGRKFIRQWYKLNPYKYQQKKKGISWSNFIDYWLVGFVYHGLFLTEDHNEEENTSNERETLQELSDNDEEAEELQSGGESHSEPESRGALTIKSKF